MIKELLPSGKVFWGTLSRNDVAGHHDVAGNLQVANAVWGVGVIVFQFYVKDGVRKQATAEYVAWGGGKNPQSQHKSHTVRFLYPSFSS